MSDFEDEFMYHSDSEDSDSEDSEPDVDLVNEYYNSNVLTREDPKGDHNDEFMRDDSIREEWSEQNHWKTCSWGKKNWAHSWEKEGWIH